MGVKWELPLLEIRAPAPSVLPKKGAPSGSSQGSSQKFRTLLASAKSESENCILALGSREREHKNRLAREPKERERKIQTARERKEHERI